MPIDNRYALVTLRIPLHDFTSDDEMNVWPPNDWPTAISDKATDYMKHVLNEMESNAEVESANMEGEVFRPEKYTYYIVWSAMGSMIAQYVELENNPPSVKDIQELVAQFGEAIVQMLRASGEPVEEPPNDIVMFSFTRVEGSPDDAIPDKTPKQSNRAPNKRDEVEGEKSDGNPRRRKHGNPKYN